MDAVQKALATSVYPDGLDGSCAAKYVPEAAELWVEYELPRQDVIPAATGYKYVKTRDQIVPVPRKQAEADKLYEKLIAQVALRTLAEAFDAAPVTLVAGIVFNGYVSAKDRATGQPVRPLLLSVDGVAVNEDPIVGGLCIIQAKRYSRLVEAESVHALAGVMDDMNAANALTHMPNPGYERSALARGRGTGRRGCPIR